MKRIKVEKNGKVITEGMWNEKFYKTKEENKVRIYVNNEEIICSKEDIKPIEGFGKEWIDKDGNTYCYKYLPDGTKEKILVHETEENKRKREEEANLIKINTTYINCQTNKAFWYDKDKKFYTVVRQEYWQDVDYEDISGTTSYCRPATEEEIKEAIDKIHEIALKENYKKDVENLKNKIKAEGEFPKKVTLPGNRIFIEDEDSIIYGGGNWIEIDDNYAYYVINNSRDGDDWSFNNAPGKIVYRIPKTKVIQLINKLLEQGKEEIKKEKISMEEIQALKPGTEIWNKENNKRVYVVAAISGGLKLKSKETGEERNYSFRQIYDILNFKNTEIIKN